MLRIITELTNTFYNLTCDTIEHIKYGYEMYLNAYEKVNKVEKPTIKEPEKVSFEYTDQILMGNKYHDEQHVFFNNSIEQYAASNSYIIKEVLDNICPNNNIKNEIISTTFNELLDKCDAFKQQLVPNLEDLKDYVDIDVEDYNIDKQMEILFDNNISDMKQKYEEIIRIIKDPIHIQRSIIMRNYNSKNINQMSQLVLQSSWIMSLVPSIMAKIISNDQYQVFDKDEIKSLLKSVFAVAKFLYSKEGIDCIKKKISLETQHKQKILQYVSK